MKGISARLLLLGTVAACGGPGGDVQADASPSGEPEWTVLFDGTDLTGWIPKIRGHVLGEDPYATFRVEDGLLTVSYDGYDRFDERFGHLFFESPFSSYEFHVEYRFVGEQMADGPGWALRNSGLMFHAQDPSTMGVDQDFPISLEAQFLGGDGSGPRPTGNLCTPGTHVQMEGALIEQHCVTAAAPTFDGDRWVAFDLVVGPDGRIAHVVEGDTVLVYDHPIVGGGNVSGFEPVAKPDGEALTGGWIALQSESHPIQFRNVRIREIR